MRGAEHTLIQMDSILAQCEMIERFSKDIGSANDLETDPLHANAILFSFIQIAEYLNKVQPDDRDLWDGINFRGIIGFRNVLTHNYDGIDYEAVFEVIKHHLPIFKNDILNRKALIEESLQSAGRNDEI